MKILHLINEPQKRGAEVFTCQLARHQKKAGHSVKILSIFPGQEQHVFQEKITVLKGSHKIRFLDLGTYKALKDFIQDFDPDIIQANAGDTLKYSVISKVVFGWKAPIVFRNASEMGRYLNSFLKKSLNSFLLGKINGVASVSRTSEKDIVRNFPFLQDKTEVIPVGLERVTNLEKHLFNSQVKKHIVHIGGFTFEKNHSGLLDIFQIILDRNPDVELHLIGDGPLRSKIVEEVQQRNLESKINFYGFIENPLPYVKAANVLILPSIIEGLPGVLLEAMYCKTPVVAYDVGGISEIVTEETGSLISKDEAETFASSVMETLNNPNLEKIENAYKMVVNNFMNDNISDQFISFYNEIIKKNK